MKQLDNLQENQMAIVFDYDPEDGGLKISQGYWFADGVDQEEADYAKTVLDGIIVMLRVDLGTILKYGSAAHMGVYLKEREEASIAEQKTEQKVNDAGAENVISLGSKRGNDG